MSWRVLAWSRELGRGKVVHAEYGEHNFDAGVAMVDDFALQEEVDVTFEGGARTGRIVQINPLGGRRNAPEALSLRLEPAGIFVLADAGDDALRAVLSAWEGKEFSLVKQSPVLLLEGFDSEVRGTPSWLAAEEALNALFDERLGVQAVVNEITGEARDVGEALDRLAEGGGSATHYQRLFRVEAHVALDWAKMTADDRKRMTDVVPRLPGWKRLHDSGLWWFGDEASWMPYLKGTKDAHGMTLTGLLSHGDWRRWRDAFIVAIRGLPLKKN